MKIYTAQIDIKLVYDAKIICPICNNEILIEENIQFWKSNIDIEYKTKEICYNCNTELNILVSPTKELKRRNKC